MNRFILDEDPVNSALALCDSHVIKMVLEEGQMLSTAHRFLDGNDAWEIVEGIASYNRNNTLYKACFFNHPCTIWARKTKGNYIWSQELFDAMSAEYSHRYFKSHKTYKQLSRYLYHPPKNIDQSLEITPFPLAMGAAEWCIDENNPIQSYRDFYHTKQYRFEMKWTNRKPPSWWKGKDWHGKIYYGGEK
jgi:hypothetical protein